MLIKDKDVKTVKEENMVLRNSLDIKAESFRHMGIKSSKAQLKIAGAQQSAIGTYALQI